MEWLRSLYPQVYQTIEASIPTYWPQLRSLFVTLFNEPLMSVAVLPLATCRAVGGEAKAAVSVSAALIAAQVSVRIFDDLEDRDRQGQLWQLVGEAQAWNYAAAVHILSCAILSQADLRPEVFQRVNQLYIDAFLYIAAGQDRDIAGITHTVEAYWATIEMKTATAYAAACASGAMVGTADPQLIEASYAYGRHVGLAVQIFNDMESIWQPDGQTDLKQGKITLPLLYGLQSNHPDRDELKALVAANQVEAQAERVKEILDKIDTKAFLTWAALKEREQALEILKIFPAGEGRDALQAFVDGMFGDLDELLQENGETVNRDVPDQPPAPFAPEPYDGILHHLERQLERASLFTHTALSQNSARLEAIEGHLYGLIDTLLAQAVVSSDGLQTAVDTVQAARAEQGHVPGLGIALRVDKAVGGETAVNCGERLHLCRAVCCQLNQFPLNQAELESGKIKWDLGRPYFIRQNSDGYCTHNHRATGQCKIYADRPLFCRRYSCVDDKRIWKDFDKMELNVEWLEENLPIPSGPRVTAVQLVDVDVLAPNTLASSDQS